MNREKITPEELLDIAISAIIDVEEQDVFIVKDLFRDIDWRHIPLDRRKRLGVLFYDYVESGEGHMVIEIIRGENGKTPKDQQKYKKL